MAGNHEVLIGLYHIGGDTALRRADARQVLADGRFVELEPEPATCLANGASDRCGIFADAGGENDRVEPAERCGERGYLAGGAMAEHFDRKSRTRFPACQELTKIRGDTGEPEHSGT